MTEFTGITSSVGGDRPRPNRQLWPTLLWVGQTPPTHPSVVATAESVDAAIRHVEARRGADGRDGRFDGVVSAGALPDGHAGQVFESVRDAWPDASCLWFGDWGVADTCEVPLCEHVPRDAGVEEALGTVLTSIGERRQRPYPIPADERERLGLLATVGRWNSVATDSLADRVADRFDASQVVVTVLGDHHTHVVGSTGGPLPTGYRVHRAASATACTVLGDGIDEIGDAGSGGWSRFVEAFDTHGYRSYLGAPLVAGGVTVGALCLLDTEPRRFQRAQKARFAVEAGQAGDVVTACLGSRSP